jgi:hypothetical protein
MATMHLTGPVVVSGTGTSTNAGSQTIAGSLQVTGQITATGGLAGNTPVNATAATLAVTAAAHAGKLVTLNRALGVAVTLPAATGTGNVYKFMVNTTASGGSYTIAVASGADFMRGLAFQFSDNAAQAAIAWGTTNTGTAATESDTITMDGSTKGGIIGDYIELTDVATTTFLVRMFTKATGTEATPFSAAV